MVFNAITTHQGRRREGKQMGCRTCEKPKMNYRKGLWSPEEDQRLRDYILKHGLGCWSAVPAKAGLQRNGKSCRLRWINYLRPGLKRGIFSQEEEDIVINLQAKLGNKWSQIAMHLPGRTDNEVKNYWNSYLKKRVMQAQGSNPNNTETSMSTATKPSSHQNIKISTTTTHDQEANISSNHANSASESIHEPFDQGQQSKNFMFSDWLPTTGHDGYSVCGNWPDSTASSGNVTPISQGAFADMSSCSYGAMQQQQDQTAHAAAVNVAGVGHFDLLNMGDIYGGFSTTNDDLFF